ncbi:MAG: ABC transporter substrate-binding protein [Acidimicrobiales bacterium]
MGGEVEGRGASGLSSWREFEFGRRLGLQTAGVIAAGVGATSLIDISKAAAAAKSSTIKIGYVSPQTGSLADFAGPDKYVLSAIRNTAIFKKGMTIGGTKYHFEITEKDTQSLSNVAVEVTQQLIADGVDLVLTTSAPETTVPVSTTCEQAHVPCLSTVVPWESYWGGFSGTSITAEGGAGGTGPKYNAMFFFGMPQFVGTFVPMVKRVQATTNCNSYFAEMFPNDADGNAFAGGWGPTVDAIFPNEFSFYAGQNGYTDLSTDYSTMIEAFKTNGPNGGQCDLFINCPLPPDFQTMWTQAKQMDWTPTIATVAKVMLFPTDAYALGSLSNNIATDAWFTPYTPYKSSLNGTTAVKFVETYQRQYKTQWVQSMGSSYSLFEITIEALKKVKSPHDREALAEALQHVSYDGICGPINMNEKSSDPMLASPATGIGIVSPVGVQWKPGSTKLVGGVKYPWSQYVVDNSLNKDVKLNGTLEPTAS